MRAAELCEPLREETPRVINLLSHALEHDPQHPQLLFSASKAFQKQGAFREAANALEVIANSKDSRAATETKAQSHRLLADLFTGPLNDRQRAIAELRQVRQLAPADIDSQRALVDLLLPQNAKEAEEICIAMVSSPSMPAQLFACQKLSQLRLAQDDRAGAETYMRQAVLLDPATDHEPFQVLERHFTRFGGDAGFVAVLGELSQKRVVPGWLAKMGVCETQRLGRIAEGLAHLRSAFEYASDDMTIAVAYLEALLAAGGNQDAGQILGNLMPRYPGHLPLLEVAERNYMALGFREDAQVVAELSAFLSQHQIKIDAFRSAHPPALSLVPGEVEHLRNALIPAALTILPHHQILAALSDQLSKVFPPSLDSYGLTSRDRIAPRAQNPNRAWLDKALSVFGCEADLYFYRGTEARVIVENSVPPAILLPESALQMIPAERLYLLARGVAKIALSAQLTDKFAPHDLTMLTYAGLWSVGHHAILPANGTNAGYAIADPEEVSKRIARVLSRKAKKMIEDVAPSFAGWDPREYLTIVERAIDRIAFVLTGNLAVSIDYIRKPQSGLSSQQLLAPENPVGELVRFALLPSTSGLRRRIATIQ
jgi:tetratricopeptide (TPR) repeat protein